MALNRAGLLRTVKIWYLSPNKVVRRKLSCLQKWLWGVNTWVVSMYIPLACSVVRRMTTVLWQWGMGVGTREGQGLKRQRE